MAYTRQYTQGVGWENEPSINTPISAENLNQMDNAIMNIDAAIAAALAGGIGAECSGHEITRLASNNEAIYADILFDDDIVNHDTHIFFLTSEYAVPEKSDSPYYWRLWVRYKIESTTMGQNIMIYDMDGEPFDDAIPVGNQFICQLHIVDPSDSTTWYISELANISAGGASTLATLSDTHIYSPSEGDVLKYSNNGYWVNAAGGDERPMSDHIVSVDSSSPKLNTSSTRIGNFKEWELFFLRCDVDAHYDSGWSGGWHIYAGGTTDIGDIVDDRDHYLDSTEFNDDISAGSVLVLARYPAPWTVWALYAIIPAASSGGSMEEYATYVYDDEIAGERHKLILRNKAWGSTTPEENALLFLRIATDSDIVYGGAPMLGWVLKYVGSSTEYNVNSMLLDFRNGKGTNIFNDTLQAGSILVLAYWSAGVHACDDSWGVLAIIPAAGGGGGTTVVANPSGTATDTLEKLQVGSAIYEIPGLDTAWAGKVTAVSGGNITPNNASFSFDPFTDGKFVILDIGVDAVKPGGVTSWSLQYTVDGNTVTRSISDKRDGNAYDPDFDDDLVSGSVIVLQYFGDNKFACVAVLDQNGGGGGASTLADLSDTTISSPTAAQPLTYDATNSKWINGGIIPAANGGTGNNSGYVRAGRKANTNIGTGATAEGLRTTASGNQSHAEGIDTVASHTGAHAEGGNTQATGVNSHAEGGGGVVASGGSSHAEGASTQASGAYSHAEGQGAKAQASAAHAQNFQTAASGNYSSAAGCYTTAGYQNQFVVGKYNDNKSANIFEVGIGTANNAKANGLELDTSGNLTVAGNITDGNGNTLSALASYLEQTVTLSTSASTTVTFTDSSITANSFIEYACSQWDLVPESITGAAGSCTIVLPKVDSAQSVTVRIYVR